MPRVSVIIPSFNHEKYIGETIESVLRQTYQDFEIVITDDGSTDNTVEIVKSFTDPRIKLFYFPRNRGACVAANHCLEHASGEYIAMLSSDDIFIESKLEKQVNFLDNHPNYGVVFSFAQIIDEDGRDFVEDEHFYTNIFIQNNRSRWEWLNYFFYRGNCLCHPSALIRRECYTAVGQYDSRFAQLPDLDFWIRICSQYEIHILPENLLKFRVRQDRANASARRPDTGVRTAIEFKQILENFLTPVIQRDFAKIFFDRLDKLSDNFPGIISFFLAQIAIQAGSLAHKSFAVDTLYRLFQKDPTIRKVIQERLEFDFIDLIQLMGQQDIFNLVNVENLEKDLIKTQLDFRQCYEKVEKIPALENQIIELQNRITYIESSRFWKFRNAWFDFKRKLRLIDDTADDYS
ncbi:glycosyltransferase [Pannus brasiliensis CCIBt3594]|uniref:Glycosyltransferase n=1 Tax=Pannus brasiliensis CCIBt3594 TaxID=1427578 RepID=A0AAW9QZS2_9CHRO